jgi:2-methylcitrate dehydratase PrpD
VVVAEGDVMTALERLAAAISGETPLSSDAGAAVVPHVVDISAAWIAGIGTAEGRALIRLHQARRGPDNPANDLMRSCALARLSEIDDIHLPSMTTPGSIVIPAALTLAHVYDKREIAPAIVAGYEAMIRLGLAIHGPAVLYRGIWPTYFGASFGTAAVAARLLGLDATKTAHALALALTVAAPGVGHHNAATTSRWLAVGLAAGNGLDAALAAQSGFTSDLAMLDGGFLPGVYDIKPDLAAFTDGLGARWKFPELSYKPWCAARQTMAATQALKEIVDTGVAASGIASVDAHVVPAHLKMIDHGVIVGDRASHLTSLPYQMAIGVLEIHATEDIGQSPAGLSAPVRALMDRIIVKAEPDFASGYPKLWPAKVRVTTTAGQVFERTVEYVPGDPVRGFDDATVAEKFRRFVAPIGGGSAAADLERLARGALADPGAMLAAIDDLCARAIRSL